MAWWVEYQAGLEESLKREFEAAFTQARLAVTAYKNEKERAWFCAAAPVVVADAVADVGDGDGDEGGGGDDDGGGGGGD